MIDAFTRGANAYFIMAEYTALDLLSSPCEDLMFNLESISLSNWWMIEMIKNMSVCSCSLRIDHGNGNIHSKFRPVQ